MPGRTTRVRLHTNTHQQTTPTPRSICMHLVPSPPLTRAVTQEDKKRFFCSLGEMHVKVSVRYGDIHTETLSATPDSQRRPRQTTPRITKAYIPSHHPNQTTFSLFPPSPTSKPTTRKGGKKQAYLLHLPGNKIGPHEEKYDMYHITHATWLFRNFCRPQERKKTTHSRSTHEGKNENPSPGTKKKKKGQSTKPKTNQKQTRARIHGYSSAIDRKGSCHTQTAPTTRPARQLSRSASETSAQTRPETRTQGIRHGNSGHCAAASSVYSGDSSSADRTALLHGNGRGRRLQRAHIFGETADGGRGG